MRKRKCPQCKVPTCRERHWKHYCVFCRNHDSNHFSRHCTVKSKQYCEEFWDACALILYHPKSRSFLLQHRSKRMRNGPDTFGIISGRRETTEWDPATTVVREAQEEFFGAGWMDKDFRQNMLYRQKVDSTYCYIVRSEDRCLGNPSCDWELNRTRYPQGHVWVTWKELEAMVFRHVRMNGIDMWEYRKRTFRRLWPRLKALVVDQRSGDNDK